MGGLLLQVSRRLVILVILEMQARGNNIFLLL